MVPLGMGTRSEQVWHQSEASPTVDVAWLCEYASELVWREAEDEWKELDGVGDEWKEGAREGRGKEMKKEGGEAVP